MTLLHILNLDLNQKKCEVKDMCSSESQARVKQSSREIYHRKPEQLRLLLKSVKTECTTPTCYNPENRKIPSLCYGLSLNFLFSGVFLESGTQRNVEYISSSSKDGPVHFLGKGKKLFSSKAKVWILKIWPQRVAFNEAAYWLIGVKFQRGDKVTPKCETPCLYHVRQNHLICLRAFANTRCAIVRPRTHC